MRIPQSSNRLFWSLQAGVWFAFGAAMSVGRIGEWPLSLIVAYEWPYAALGFVTTLGLHLFYRHVPVGGENLGRMLLASIIGSYAGAIIWTASFHLYLARLGAVVHGALSGAPSDLGYDGPLLDNTVFYSFTMLAWSVLYFGFQSYHVVLEARERSLRAEARAHEAQLRALRYQLNPHFIFNALNSISTLVAEHRSREARSMIARLSEFLRRALEGDDAPEVPLSEEVEFVRCYLEIEQVRFAERVRVRFDVEPEVLNTPVPALILQPLVENAIKHAISPRSEGGSLCIEARRAAGALRITVSDDGPGMIPTATGGLGIGLSNTRERLRQLYGESGRLELAEAEGGGLRATVTIPLKPARTPAPVEVVAR